MTGFGCAVGGDVDEQNDAWDHNLAVEARDFMRTYAVTPGRDVPSVKVRWPADRTAYDRPDWFSPNGTISIGPIEPFERFFMKQYGHHVLQHFADYPVRTSTTASATTRSTRSASRRVAAAGRRRTAPSTGRRDSRSSCPRSSHSSGATGLRRVLYRAGPHPIRTRTSTGPEVTATILWNTLGWATALGETVGMDTDGNNHDGNNSRDNLSVGFETIWDAIINFDPASGDPAHNHPQTIGEFWLAFAFFYPDLANRLSAVYDESHITMLAANLEQDWVSGSPAVVSPGGALTIDDIAPTPAT